MCLTGNKYDSTDKSNEHPAVKLKPSASETKLAVKTVADSTESEMHQSSYNFGKCSSSHCIEQQLTIYHEPEEEECVQSMESTGHCSPECMCRRKNDGNH